MSAGLRETVVRGHQVVVGVDDAGAAELIPDGAVLVRDGLVAELGGFAELSRRHPGAEIVGSGRYVVAPGLVNAHHHVGLTPLQLGSPDLPLELWIVRRIAARLVDLYLDTLYSAFEMVQSGVTTVQHLHSRLPRPVANIVKGAGEVIRAYRDIGMRASYSFATRDQNRLLYEADDRVVARLPAEIRAAASEYLAEQSVSLEELLEVFEALHAANAGEERIAIQLSPHNLQWCSDRALIRLSELSRTRGVPMHMHLVETPLQKEYARRRSGTTAVRHLHELGVLGPEMTLGHGVWLTEADIATLAETGTAVCHNCGSNLRLRSGVAALNSFRRHGVPVALGIDEAGINDDRDMLLEMRLVLRLHRVPCLVEDQVPSCAEVFRMATQGGARTTPFAGRIGRLAPGMAADLVLHDWERLAAPYLSPDVPVLDALVQRAQSGGVALVMVGGEVIYRDGRFTRVDREAALAALAEAMRAPASAIEQRNRQLGLALFEEAQRFYAGYLAEEPPRDPFYKPSSRV